MSKVCFWCDLPAAKLLNGTFYCDSHAMCAHCLKPLEDQALTCPCYKSGYLGHEEDLYCSDTCFDACHPPYEPSEGESE